MKQRVLSLLFETFILLFGLAFMFGTLFLAFDRTSPMYSILDRLILFLKPAQAIFLAILVESFPFLFIGALLSSCIHVLVKEEQIIKRIPKNKYVSIFTAALLGFVFPVCDCGTFPVANSLLRKGIPQTAVIAFVLAAPVLNPVAILATYFAFGMNIHITFLRVMTTFVIACVVSFLAGENSGQQDRSAGFPSKFGQATTIENQHAKANKSNRLRLIIHHTVEELYGILGFFICSAAVSSLYQVYHAHQSTVSNHSGLVAVFTLMVLAIIFSLCSSADAFVARSFASAYPTGAILAFMVIGQMIDLRNLILIPKTFGMKTAWKIILPSFLLCFIMGIIL
jgi:uncharacterized membrane protein YraQ (UPF0718 family)